MSSRPIYSLAKAQWCFLASILLLAYGSVAFAPAMAAETKTMEFVVQALDLDTGTLVEESNLSEPSDADVQLAYNALRATHAVVVPVGISGEVELAFVQDVGFDGVTAEVVAGLTFSTEPVDLPFSANNTVVVKTSAGGVFKLGNAVESAESVTFNYAQVL